MQKKRNENKDREEGIGRQSKMELPSMEFTFHLMCSAVKSIMWLIFHLAWTSFASQKFLEWLSILRRLLTHPEAVAFWPLWLLLNSWIRSLSGYWNSKTLTFSQLIELCSYPDFQQQEIEGTILTWCWVSAVLLHWNNTVAKVPHLRHQLDH